MLDSWHYVDCCQLCYCSDLLLADNLLSCLYPGDDGSVSPNPANTYLPLWVLARYLFTVAKSVNKIIVETIWIWIMIWITPKRYSRVLLPEGFLKSSTFWFRYPPCGSKYKIRGISVVFIMQDPDYNPDHSKVSYCVAVPWTVNEHSLFDIHKRFELSCSLADTHAHTHTRTHTRTHTVTNTPSPFIV